MGRNVSLTPLLYLPNGCRIAHAYAASWAQGSIGSIGLPIPNLKAWALLLSHIWLTSALGSFYCLLVFWFCSNGSWWATVGVWMQNLKGLWHHPGGLFWCSVRMSPKGKCELASCRRILEFFGKCLTQLLKACNRTISKSTLRVPFFCYVIVCNQHCFMRVGAKQYAFKYKMKCCSINWINTETFFYPLNLERGGGFCCCFVVLYWAPQANTSFVKQNLVNLKVQAA